MKEFEKWRDEQHTGTGIYTTAAIRKGWKAALEWVLKNRKPYYDLEDKKVVAIDSDILYKELEE